MTDLGESALTQIMVRFTDYRTLLGLTASSTDRRAGRHQVISPVSRHGNTLTDIVAVVEHFTTARLLTLRPDISQDHVAQWKARAAAWRQQGGVDLAAFGGWQAFMGFVEVRNALAHGLGRLTERQLGKHRAEILAQIAATGARLDGDLVLVATPDVEQCARISEQFIHFLDLAAPQS